ncbi:GmrSD restriction endonuclease domain-containing protein, partial [Psychrobacter sp. 1U2]
SDLVKNLLLKTIKSSNNTYDSPKQAWNILIKGFDDISENNAIDTFLLHYWISKQEYTTEKKLFAYVKDYVLKSPENAKELLESLSQSAIDYCKMLSPENMLWTKEQFEIKLSLESLNSFKVKQQYSFVLSLLSAYTQRNITLKQLKTMLNKIEHFHFVFNAITQQRSSGSIASMYSQHAINLSTTNDENEIQKILTSLSRKLEDKLPSYEEFEVKFLELIYLSNRTKSKSIIKYALRRLVGNNTNGLDIDHDNLTIEHLIPEAKIKTGMDSDIIGSIGNLILTDSNTNGHRLKDKEPAEKIDILRQAGYPLSKFFLDNTVWDENDVLERTKKLSKALY